MTVEVKHRTARPKWAARLSEVNVDGERRGVVVHLTNGTFEAWRAGCSFDSPYSTVEEAVDALVEVGS